MENTKTRSLVEREREWSVFPKVPPVSPRSQGSHGSRTFSTLPCDSRVPIGYPGFPAFSAGTRDFE